MGRKTETKLLESRTREASHIVAVFENMSQTDTSQLKAIKEIIPPPAVVGRPAGERIIKESSGLLPKIVRAQSKSWFMAFLTGLFSK